jgi:tetratricopeptide (TPR) repeat protein
LQRVAQLKQEAIDASLHGDLNLSIEIFTMALQIFPSALLFARRAEVLLMAQRPTAALSDCNRALEINPESSKVSLCMPHPSWSLPNGCTDVAFLTRKYSRCHRSPANERTKALKMRGQVQRVFGEWALAANDLAKGLALDHDVVSAQILEVLLQKAFISLSLCFIALALSSSFE